MQCQVLSSVTKQVNEHLTHKYDIHFNFFLTKPTNEIIYNHTCSTSTIDFKDTIILADTNQYLKRYYFLKNALDKDEIYDRINLLAEFYGNAVLLKYEYPLMVLTRTKAIFLKRLKRMKKILVEEGSSDESKTPVEEEEKAVSINSSRFLKSISSSELQRKSVDQLSRMQLDFSMFKDDDPQIHDIFGENQDSPAIQNSIFLANIVKFTKEIACELVLDKNQNEEELSHLMVDFDEVDREEVMTKYQKIVQKENRALNNEKQSLLRKETANKNSRHPQVPPQKLKDLMGRKPMATSIMITALQNQQKPPLFNNSSPLQHRNQDYFRKKSMISPRLSQNAALNPNDMASNIKRSSIYQYEVEHIPFPLTNQFAIPENSMQDSPKNSMARQLKFSSAQHQGADLGRAYYSNREKFMSSIPERQWDYNSPKAKYSAILNKEDFKSRSKIFSNEKDAQRIRSFQLRDFDRVKGQQPFGQYDGHYPGPGVPPNHRTTSINININNLEEKKEDHRVNVKVNNKNKFGLAEDYKEQERNFRAEKKKKIREKAAALLNRVKSQDYMRPIQEVDRYEYQQNDRNYGERYYG